MKKKTFRQIVPLEMIEGRIFISHGVKVILDTDLVELYGVSTKRLNEQVRRNRDKFPEDFMSMGDRRAFSFKVTKFGLGRRC